MRNRGHYLCCFFLWASLFVNFCGYDTAIAGVHKSFSFSQGMDGWGVWGEGTGRHVTGLGHSGPGAVELRCNKGQQMTMHQNFKLAPGRYKITAQLRSLDVQKGKWDYSIWLFYQAGEKITSPVTNISGTFNWSEVTYTIDVTDRPVDIWFRLKSAGTLWVDDVEIVSFAGAANDYSFQKSSVDFPMPNLRGTGLRCDNCYRWMDKDLQFCTICGEPLGTGRVLQKRKTEPVKVLLGFEGKEEKRENSFHYIRTFSDRNATSGHRSAVIKFGEYNNLRIEDAEFGNWSGYDYLAMDVFNPLDEQVKFALCINDTNGGGYWNQLNHYSTLTKGWNNLRFSINRYVGERGSVRVKRYLDLGHIQKAWFAIAPEDKRKYRDQFLVDNIRLTQAPEILADTSGMYLFDFVKEGFRTQNGFIGIETKHNYHKDIGFGFVDANIWRSHDSIYADSLYRDGIFVNKGDFRIDVPNGKYIVRLVPFALGEWYEHFWTKRHIKIQGKSVVNDRRDSANDYLENFLRFSEIEPKPSDNPYDLYLKRVFEEIVTEVNVTDGKIIIECNGDDSAIMLNSIIIYPIEQQRSAKNFLEQLYLVQKDEFETISRKIEPKAIHEAGAINEQDVERGFYSALIDSATQLRYNQVFKSQGDSINLTGGRLQRPVQALLVRNLRRPVGRLTVSSSSLVSTTGQKIKVKPDWLRYGVAQYQSHTFNHETYELAPRFLRNFPVGGLEIDKDYSLLIWLQVPITENVVTGDYTGTINVSLHGQQVNYPVNLLVKDFTLPEVDIAVGFFGLDPIPFSYFKEDGVNEIQKSNRTQVLHALRQRGFSTWSSLPESTFIKKGNRWAVKAAEVDWLMNEARQLGFSEKVFSYGGGFPVVLDKYGDIEDQPQDDYRRKTALELRKHMSKKEWLPVVFDISDEASGYSQKVDRDLKRAAMLTEYFPFLRIGGYSHPIPDGKQGAQLNRMLNDISLSSFTENYVQKIQKRGDRWGLYNQSIGLFTNNRKDFGQKLIKARQKGCDHVLGWHLVLSQNYPYYDLDGRENDAMMIFPRRDGTFDYALKFEWAAQGLEEYRLQLLPKENAHQGAKL